MASQRLIEIIEQASQGQTSQSISQEKSDEEEEDGEGDLFRGSPTYFEYADCDDDIDPVPDPESPPHAVLPSQARIMNSPKAFTEVVASALHTVKAKRTELQMFSQQVYQPLTQGNVSQDSIDSAPPSPIKASIPKAKTPTPPVDPVLEDDIQSDSPETSDQEEEAPVVTAHRPTGSYRSEDATKVRFLYQVDQIPYRTSFPGFPSTQLEPGASILTRKSTPQNPPPQKIPIPHQPHGARELPKPKLAPIEIPRKHIEVAFEPVMIPTKKADFPFLAGPQMMKPKPEPMTTHGHGFQEPRAPVMLSKEAFTFPKVHPALANNESDEIEDVEWTSTPRKKSRLTVQGQYSAPEKREKKEKRDKREKQKKREKERHKVKSESRSSHEDEAVKKKRSAQEHERHAKKHKSTSGSKQEISSKSKHKSSHGDSSKKAEPREQPNTANLPPVLHHSDPSLRSPHMLPFGSDPTSPIMTASSMMESSSMKLGSLRFIRAQIHGSAKEEKPSHPKPTHPKPAPSKPISSVDRPAQLSLDTGRITSSIRKKLERRARMEVADKPRKIRKLNHPASPASSVGQTTPGEPGEEEKIRISPPRGVLQEPQGEDFPATAAYGSVTSDSADEDDMQVDGPVVPPRDTSRIQFHQQDHQNRFDQSQSFRVHQQDYQTLFDPISISPTKQVVSEESPTKFDSTFSLDPDRISISPTKPSPDSRFLVDSEKINLSPSGFSPTKPTGIDPKFLLEKFSLSPLSNLSPSARQDTRFSLDAGDTSPIKEVGGHRQDGGMYMTFEPGKLSLSSIEEQPDTEMKDHMKSQSQVVETRHVVYPDPDPDPEFEQSGGDTSDPPPFQPSPVTAVDTSDSGGPGQAFQPEDHQLQQQQGPSTDSSEIQPEDFRIPEAQLASFDIESPERPPPQEEGDIQMKQIEIPLQDTTPSPKQLHFGNFKFLYLPRKEPPRLQQIVKDMTNQGLVALQYQEPFLSNPKDATRAPLKTRDTVPIIYGSTQQHQQPLKVVTERREPIEIQSSHESNDEEELIYSQLQDDLQLLCEVSASPSFLIPLSCGFCT